MLKKIVFSGIIVMGVMASSAALAAEPVKIGVAAMISPKDTVRYYKQLIDYVGLKLGSPVEMVQKENYDEMDSLLEHGAVQMAFICSGPYVKDHAKFGVELLVAPQSHGQPFYHGYIIVHKDSPIKDLAGLQGKKFAFTDPRSNTGKLVPTYMVAREYGMTPEKFFGDIVYTRNHDKSIEAVAKKIVDGASVDSLIYDYAAKKNPAYTAGTRILRKSPPYGIPPLVVNRGMNAELKNKLKSIFLSMHADPAGKAILDGMMVEKFIVPKDDDYNSVREMEAWMSKMK